MITAAKTLIGKKSLIQLVIAKTTKQINNFPFGVSTKLCFLFNKKMFFYKHKKFNNVVLLIEG